MSLDFGWRRFNFYDKNVVMDPQNPSKKFDGIKAVVNPGWTSPSDGACVYIYEPKGAVFSLTHDLEEFYWKAHHNVLTHALAMGNSTLITIGEDEERVNSLMKIWDCQNLAGDMVNAVPPLKRTIRLSSLLGPLGGEVSATVVAGHSNMRIVSVGFSDGSVLCYIGDYIKDKAASSRWIRLRECSPQDGKATGLAIAALNSVSAENSYVVFVITLRSVHSIVIDSKGNVINKLRHDAEGVGKDCWCFSEQNNQLIVATRDMTYSFDAEQSRDPEGTKGRCHALNKGQEKQQIVKLGQHLVLITKQPAIIASSESEWMSMVTVYDVGGQYIAFSCSLPSFAWMFLLRGKLMLLSHDGTLSSLTEKHLNAKLDMLFRKNFYDVAIQVAKQSDGGASVLPSIHAKYADYLYGKGDFENAIKEYKETIGVLEPSYVIKRFLDGSKILQLCSYLEAIQKKKKNNSYHSTILVNCYAKLGEKKRIMEMIENISESNADKDHADAVVKALRTAKLPMEASILAMKFGLHDSVLNLLIQDLKLVTGLRACILRITVKVRKYAQAVKYFTKLNREDKYRYVESYGRVLLANCPTETMEMLQGLLKDKNRDEEDTARLLTAFIGDETRALSFIQQIVNQDKENKKESYLVTTMIELLLRAHKNGSDLSVESALLPFVTRENQEKIVRLADLFECDNAVEAVLSMREDSRPSLLAFYIRRGRIADLIRLATEMDDDNVWMETLVCISKSGDNVKEDDLKTLLENVRKSNRVHPLVVLETLSRNSSLKVEVVKGHILEWLTAQKAQIEEDKKVIAENEQKVQECAKELKSLRFNPQVLQLSKCSACDTQLHQPSVHFLCRHAYHINCLNSFIDNLDTCPACHPTGSAATRKESPAVDLSSYSNFAESLNKAPNSMEVISHYLQNGLFDNKKTPSDFSGLSSATSSSLPSPYKKEQHRKKQESVPKPIVTKVVPSQESGSQPRSLPASQPATSRRSTNPFEDPEISVVSKTSKNPFVEESTNPFEDD